MNSVYVLNEIKSFLEENVSKQIKLQKASDNDIFAYELVSPSVFTGWLPPNGMLPDNIGDVPCLIVGMDGGSDDGSINEFKIKISFAVYSPGEHKEQGEYTPNFNGYVDLLNLIDLTKSQLVKEKIINNTLCIGEEISWDMYQDQPYPYWYGYMTFGISGKAYPKVNIEKLLNT